MTESQPVSPKRVLFVDDESSVRLAIHMLLTHDGHSVEAAENGPEALEKFASSTFDIVLTDNYMPGMDGVEFAAKIKERAPGLPVIMLTAFPPAEKPETIDVVLTKPFLLDSLRKGMAQVFEASQARSDVA